MARLVGLSSGLEPSLWPAELDQFRRGIDYPNVESGRRRERYRECKNRINPLHSSVEKKPTLITHS